MTEQMFLFTCRDVQKYAFDYRRGELPTDDVRKLEAHVESCEACQVYLDRLEGMLDAAATHDFAADLDADAVFERVRDVVGDRRTGPGQTVPIDRDALFARITGELGAAQSDEPPPSGRISDRPAEGAPPPVTVPELLREPDEPSDEPANDDEPRPWRTRAYVALALAAGIAIGVGIARLDPGAPPAPPVEVALEDEKKLELLVRADDEAPLELDGLALQPTPSAIKDVKVFGNPEANWTIKTQGARRRLELDSGTVLVEFVPRADTSLQFVTERFTVHVTGTVFYVSAEEGVVGVVTGSVEVESDDGETVELTDGEQWSLTDGTRRAPSAAVEAAARLVDPATHREALARANSEPARERVAPRPPVSKEVAATPTASLRDAADDALRRGRYGEAAQYYERMVVELSASDPANATLRLDLARIYIQHLDRPARAADHLRQFLADRPADPAAPSARDELCRIADTTGEREPLCDR